MKRTLFAAAFAFLALTANARTSLPVGMTAYNLMGQKVYYDYHDITVVNGKKYIKR
jgi:hypothetical protein